MTPAQLAAMLVDAKGGLVHPRLFVDWGADLPGRATMKSAAFWTDPAWTGALKRYRELGGKVLDAGYVTLEGDGRQDLTVKLTATSDKARELVLRVGSTSAITIRRGDSEAFSAPAGLSQPDTGSVLLKVPEGKTELSVVLRAGTLQRAWLRVSDTRGLPIEGSSLTR